MLPLPHQLLPHLINPAERFSWSNQQHRRLRLKWITLLFLLYGTVSPSFLWLSHSVAQSPAGYLFVIGFSHLSQSSPSLQPQSLSMWMGASFTSRGFMDLWHGLCAGAAQNSDMLLCPSSIQPRDGAAFPPFTGKRLSKYRKRVFSSLSCLIVLRFFTNIGCKFKNQDRNTNSGWTVHRY